MPAKYFPKPEWIQQADALLNQAGPVQNTWYPVLALTGRYTRLRNVFVRVETADETIEVEVVVDGLTLVGQAALTFGQSHMTRNNPYPVAATVLDIVAADSFNWDEIGHDISVRVRKITAAGAGNLSCRVVYALD